MSPSTFAADSAPSITPTKTVRIKRVSSSSSLSSLNSSGQPQRYASFWRITRTCQKDWVKSAGTVPAIHQPPGSPDANDTLLTPALCHLILAVAIRRMVFLLTPAFAGEVSMADCKTFSVTCFDSALRRNALRSTLTPGNASAVRRTEFQTSSGPRPGGNSSLLVEGVLGLTLTLSIVSS